MAVATTSDGRCIRARDSADTLHGWRCGGWGGSGVVDTKKWTNKLPLGSPFTPSHFSEEQELNSSIYAAAFRRPLICHEQLLLSLCDGSLQVCGEFDRFLPQKVDRKKKNCHAMQLRMRKQRHLDGLTAQVAHLPRDNAHVATVLGLTTQGLLAVDAENAVLRT
uniref:Uncharacterized protein n=1 Tax=Oryza rufipogon TaxID=4529 RepID=A0A0E0R8Q3_ORYRU